MHGVVDKYLNVQQIVLTIYHAILLRNCTCIDQRWKIQKTIGIIIVCIGWLLLPSWSASVIPLNLDPTGEDWQHWRPCQYCCWECWRGNQEPGEGRDLCLLCNQWHSACQQYTKLTQLIDLGFLMLREIAIKKIREKWHTACQKKNQSVLWWFCAVKATSTALYIVIIHGTAALKKDFTLMDWDLLLRQQEITQ